MDYSQSWTQPGQGYDLEEGVTMTMQPDNPKDRIGNAVNRIKDYGHIFVNGMKPVQAKEFIKDFTIDPKWLNRKYPWKDVTNNRRKNLEHLGGGKVRIGNYKAGGGKLNSSLGGSQGDIVAVQKQIKDWIEANGGGNVRISSILNSQT